MKKFVAVACVFVMLVNISGCGGMKGESELKDLIKIQKDAKEAMAKDPAKGVEYLPKMMAAAKKFEDVKLTDDEKKKLFDKYKSDLEAMGMKDYKDMK